MIGQLSAAAPGVRLRAIQPGGRMRPRISRSTVRKAGRISLIGVWVASFALLFQTVLPLLNRPASAKDTAAPFAGDLVLCTSHGLAAPSDTTKDRSDEGTTRAQNCPLCQVWQNLGSALPASAPSVLGPIFEARPSACASADATPSHHRDPLQARAPPLVA
jgi:hypothetical protein